MKTFNDILAERRIEFCDTSKKYDYSEHFTRGYDDRQCGRAYSLNYPGGTVAGDAYRAGWNLANIHAKSN